MQEVVPALRIRSYEVSRTFYENLGFREQGKHQFESDLPVFAAIERDGWESAELSHTLSNVARQTNMRSAVQSLREMRTLPRPNLSTSIRTFP